jgi:hypothetical protein
MSITRVFHVADGEESATPKYIKIRARSGDSGVHSRSPQEEGLLAANQFQHMPQGLSLKLIDDLGELGNGVQCIKATKNRALADKDGHRCMCPVYSVA